MLGIARAMFIDIGSYGLKEWLAILGSLIGIGGSIFGLWRAWRYSKKQIAERLLEFLRDEEAKIVDARSRIILNLRCQGQPDNEPDHAFYRGLREVLQGLGRGPTHEAEKKLDRLAEAWSHDAKVAQKFLSNANVQLATALLIRGKIARDRAEPTAARAAWQEALHAYPHDCEAARYLGELALANGDIESALEHFSKAYALAPDDKMLSAETWELVADYYHREGRRRQGLAALRECASDFADAGMYARSAVAYARAGDLAAQLGAHKQAPELLREAFWNFNGAGDSRGMVATRKKLEDMEQDVSDLPEAIVSPERPVRWQKIRLTLEFSVLAAAAVLFYLSLR